MSERALSLSLPPPVHTMDTKQSNSQPAVGTRLSSLGDVPPLYHISADGMNSPPLGDIPPNYDMTVASQRVQHSYTLERGTKTWLTFELESRAPSADSPPYFFGHAPISGRIVLDLDRPEYITSIAIKIEGRWVGREQIGSGVGRNIDDSITFLKTSEPIWTAACTSVGIMSVLSRREGEKIEGHKVFPFSVQLPETVECAAGETYGVPSFPLPATFAEPGARAGVFYTIGAVVHRGKLSTSDAIHQRFRWAPAIHPPSLSHARREAYESGTGEIPGIVEDPDGWEILDPVKVSGEAFGQRQVEAEYTLSLAKPLSYTRGSIIPLSLSIQCADEQVLDLVSASSSPIVKLLCNLHYTSRVKGKQGADRPPTAVHGPIDASYYAEFRAAQGAVWWVPTAQPDTGVRHLRGEIHIDPGLKPGLLTPEFRLFYTVGLFAPDVPSFALTHESAREGGGRRMPLVAREIELATLYAQDGPRPISVTPPAYDKGEKWPVLAAITTRS